MQIGVLDFAFIGAARSPAERLAQMLETARVADDLGYSRYWVSEHHSADVAHTAPEVAVAAILASTRRIRAGSAGVLLRYYSPYKVGEVFRSLEALAPERVDLGVGRGAADPLTTRALLDAGSDQGYDRKVIELASYVRGGAHGIPCHPAGVGAPSVWVLGSGMGSAPLAATTGASFSFGMFLRTAEDPRKAIQLYRDRFRAATGETARVNIAMAAICAPTEAQASALREAHQNPFITPNVAGTPEQVREHVATIAETYGVDEVVIAPLGGHEERLFAVRALAPQRPAVMLAP